MAQPPGSPTAPHQTDTGLERFARTVQPHLARLDAALSRRLKAAQPGHARDTRRLKALSLITTGAAARIVFAGKTAEDFFEQAAYNSRRLAKLNVPPPEVVEVLREYDRDLDAVLPRRYPHQLAALDAARQYLHFHIQLTVNNAYYQVREAETQAFYGLLRAEMDATGLDDLLQRFILILTRTFRAQSGRLFPLSEESSIGARVLRRLARPRYIAGGSAGEELVLDPGMRGHYQSYWSIPYASGGRVAGLIQFGFPTPYRWLPRELDLARAFAERCVRAAERVRLVQELSVREGEVRALAGRLLAAEHEERERISRELHDEAGQSMLFLRLHLELLERGAPPDLQPKLAEARAVTERIIAEIRRIIGALRPSAVEDFGLPAAIRHLSARFRKLYPVEVSLRLTPYCACLPRTTEAAIYRVVQECYQNIAKHALASHINLSLKATDKLLELNVEDDGAGFDAESGATQPKSFGLRGMRERVALLGGRLEIRSRPGQGTAIHVRVPILPPSASQCPTEPRL